MVISRWIKPDTKLYVSLNDISRSLDWIFEFRPVWFFPIWILMTSGMSAAKGVAEPEFYWWTAVDWSVFYLFVGVTVLISATLINIAGARIRGSSRIVLTAGVSVTVLTVGYMAVTGHSNVWISLLWAIMAFFALQTYFRRCVNEKETLPVKGVPLTAAASLALFMIGWQIVSADIVAGFVKSVPYLLGSQAVFILLPALNSAEHADHFRDKVGGVKRELALATISVAMAAVSGYLLHDPVASTAGIVSFPFFIVALLSPRAEHVMRTVRYPILILAIFVCVRYPWCFAALFITFYLTKLYHYFRFSVDYPTFHVGHD